MRRYWYRRILIMIVVFCVAVGGGYYLIDSKKQMFRQEVSADTSDETMVIPGGMPIGIYLETEGVMVLGTDEITGVDGMKHEPSAHKVKAGDYITGINHKSIKDKSELIEAVNMLDSDEVILDIHRKDEDIEVKTQAVQFDAGGYKLGIWVRDNGVRSRDSRYRYQ